MNPSGNRYTLDTSAYSQLQRGRTEVLSLLAAADHVYMPTIVLGELEAGFRLGSKYQQNKRVLEQFLGETFVSVTLVTPTVAMNYGKIFRSLRQRGTPIPINDVWIAASSASENSVLLTFDRDFTLIEELECLLLEA